MNTYIQINNYTAMLHTLTDYDTWYIYDFIRLVYLKNVLRQFFRNLTCPCLNKIS